MIRTLLNKASVTEVLAEGAAIAESRLPLEAAAAGAAAGVPPEAAKAIAERMARGGAAAIDPAATIDWSNEQWLLHAFRAGTTIVLAFQMVYFVADWRWSGAPHAAILPWHVFNIVISLIFLGITYLRSYQRRMAEVILVSCGLLFWSTAALAIIALNSDLLTFTLTITMVGAAAMVPWNWRWQAGLAIASVAALAAFTLMGGWSNPHLENDWIALIAAIGVAHYAALAGERYRREIAHRIMALQSSGRELIGEIAQREAAVASIGAVNRRLRESETKLRKIFATTSDIITINRLSDGRYMDFNQSFERLGYSRAEVLAQSAGSLGIWAKRAQLRDFMGQIRKTGAVANFDHDTRAKDGTVYQYQASATIVELGGQECVVAVSRDNTAIKRSERELRAAREMMQAKIETLQLTENLLREEIRERAAAVAASDLSNQRLRESEAKLRKIFETCADAITISRLSDGLYLEVNEVFYRTGYSPAETLGRSAAQMGIFAHPAQLYELVHKLKANGTVANFECEVRTKGGAILPCLTSATVVELDGEDCVVAIARDISAIKRTERDLIAAREAMRAQIATLEDTEERLRAEIVERARAMDQREEALRNLADSEGKLRRFFEVSPDSISIARMSDGKITAVNESLCAMSGRTAEELIGRRSVDTGIWADAAAFKEFSKHLIAHGQVRDMDAMLQHRSGRIIPHSVSAVVAELGGERCAISIAHDITDRKRVETELLAAREAALAASQSKSEFLSSMSHEIRTPMNAILGMADMLWESNLNAEQRRYLATMRSNSKTLLDLINEILDLAKVESGRLHLEQIPIDLRDLMEKMLETLSLRAHSKGLELIGRIVPGTPTRLLGDPLRLRQILFNLVGNAIKFTAAGEIELTLERTGPPLADTVTRPPRSGGAGRALVADGDARTWMRFTVRDTGIGISAMQARTIFSSFTQADSSIARKYGGSGLGLTIVKRLVELMGGAIAVASMPRTGSTFTVTVPLQIAAADDEPAVAERPADDPAALAGVRVLLLDHCAPSRVMVSEMLAAAGATVDDALGGGAGRAKPVNNNSNMVTYNVLLIDERSSAADGIEEVRGLAGGAVEGAAGASIVMMTNALPASAPDRKDHTGADTGRECRYLVKPIKRADLLGALMEITGRKSPDHAMGAFDIQPLRNGSDPRPSVAPTDLRPLRILLADDSPDNRMLIDAYMKKAPYTIDHAEDGSIAVEKVKANHYDLVLMDIQMPVMDGYTATRTIREWERTQGLARMPIIALTASALDESVRRSLEAGCDAHISKPVKKSTLFEVILEITGAAASAVAANGSAPLATNGVPQIPRLRIQVDADLRDLVPDFLAHKRANVGTIRDAIDLADFKTISQIGHKMKGEGGSYGFDAVTAMGAVLEQAALDRDLATARHTLAEFAAYLDSIDVVYG